MANETFSATQTTVLTSDVDNDGQIDPGGPGVGDTVTTTVIITNNSTNTAATGVTFTETLQGMTLVDQPGSLDNINVSPIAFDDGGYTAAGNVLFTATASVLGNDTEPLGPEDFALNAGTVIANAGPITTAQGGSVTLNANGTFTYVSAVGFEGIDTFTYTLRDTGLDGAVGGGDDLTSTAATVSITVGPSVWFIDNSFAVNGNGTQASPFNSIAAFNAAQGQPNGPDSGDFIYLRFGTGTYSEADGINLADGQTLIGNGDDLVVNLVTIEVGTAGLTPTIQVTGAGGEGVQLAQNNTLSGFNISTTNAAADGIEDGGGTVGTLTISNVSISGTGQAVDIDQGGTLNVTLASVTSTGASEEGIQLAGVAGSFTATTVSLNGMTGDAVDLDGNSATVAINGGSIGNSNDPGGIGVDINGGNGNVTISATINKTTASDVVEVTGRTGGTVDFNGNITSNTNGIDITGNTGGTVRFDGGMNLSTGATTAFNSTGNTGMTLVVTDPGAGSNILTTTTGTALNVANTTIGAEDLTFQSISSNGGSNAGIVLNNTGSLGGLHVTGTGTAGSGGTIANKTGADITSGSGVVTYNGTTVGTGMILINTSDVSLDRMQLNDFSNFAIYSENVNGLTLNNTTVSGNNGESAAQDESSITLREGSGTIAITNSNISGGFENNLNILYENATAKTAVYNMTDNTFSDLQSGNNALVNLRSTTTASASSNVTFNIGDSSNAALGNTFDNSANQNPLPPPETQWFGDGILVTFEGPFQHTINIDNNTFNELFQAIDFAANFSADVNARIYNNTITYTEGVGAIAFGTGSSSTSSMLFQMLIEDNDIGGLGNDSGSRLGSGIVGDFRGAETARVTIHQNVVQDAEVNPIRIISQMTLGQDGDTHLRITNNTVASIDDDAGAGAGVIPGIEVTTNAATNGDIFLTISGNISTGINEDGILVRQATANNTFQLEDFAGNGTVAADVDAYLEAQNPGTTARVRTGGSVVDYGTMNQNNTNTPAPVTPLLAAEGGVEAATATPTDDTTNTNDTPDTGADPQPLPVDDTAPVGTATDPAPDSVTPAPAHPVIIDDGVLTQAELNTFVDAAIARWSEAGLTQEQLDALEAMSFGVADMSGLNLGSFSPSQITLDADAGGRGWYLDGSPLDDAEFGTIFSATWLQTDPSGAPAGHYDLLTTVMHEMGHALGLGDSYASDDRGELMYGWLYTGERRLPGEGDGDGAVAGSITSEEFLGAPLDIGVLPFGKSVTIQWQATINAQTNQLIVNPSNQGTVAADNAVGFLDTLTDDPAVGGANDPTITQLDTLSLGNLVFNDVNKDGLFDGGDSGVNGVILSLFADATNDGVIDNETTPLATATTAGGGLYSFAGLAPGNYIVRVDLANFQAGGALNALNLQVSSTGNADPDNNVDNDDNGSRAPGAAAYSQTITLAYNDEPDGTPDVDGDADADSNLTLDFGFISNTPPTAANVGPFTGAEDATSPARIAITLSGTDADVGDAVVSFTIATLAANGQLFDAATGGTLLGAGSTVPATGSGPWTATVYFQPNADWNGATSFTYTAFDGDQNSAAATASITVDATNDPVTGAAPANASVNEDAPTAITGLSIADVDTTLAPGGTYQVTLSSTNGTLTLGAGTLAALSFSTGDGTADATMTFTGTLANINTALATASYTSDLDFNGSATITLQVTDDVGGIVATGTGAGTSDSDVINVTVNAANDPVTGAAPANASVNEDTPTAITGMSIADVDATLAPGGTYQVTLSSTNGTLTLGAGTLAALSFTTGDGTADATMTFTGTLADINTALGTASYASNADFNGSATVTLQVTDDVGGIVATGIGAGTSDSDVINVTVNATNDPVTGTAPANASVAEDGSVAIAGMSIADVDATLAPGGTYQVTLSSTNGTLTLGAGTLAVLSFSTGDGTADATMTFAGTLANINTALATASYTSDPDFNGAATITLQVTDDVGGIVATGTGAGTSDSDVINVTVNAVADIVADTLTTTEDNAVIANVITGTNGASADNFEAAAVIQSVTQGTNGAVTFLANGEVTYTPDDDFNGSDTFQYTVLSGGVTETATVTVNIGAVNDDPVVASGIADQASPSNAEWSFQVPEDAFDDVDGDVLTYAASLDGNPLPAWLTFNGANRTFTGTPPLDFVGTLALKVTASDASLASVSDTFNLDIVQSPSPDINLSEGDDNFIGTGLGEVINGLGGNDNIQGGAGNDRINGNAGNDNILGGSGANVLHGNDGGDFLTAVGNLNTAFGDAGSDQLFFVGNQNQLYGGEGNDWHGVSGNGNALAAGAGDDFLGASGNGNTLAGQDGTDFLFAVGAGNALHGETGNDWLGVSGNFNILFGGAGNDWLGATGNGNTLDGGAGNDTLVAAPGSHQGDVFNYRAGYAQDEVIGFARHNAGGTDVVSIQGFGVTTFLQLQGLMTQSGADTVITFNTADILTMRNVLPSQWLATDFQLA